MDIAITHYEAFKKFLASHLAKEQANGSRTNARDKLTRLTKQQFQELSTDVYDELSRRLLGSNAVPFLPVCDDFHPKRNQARQKLATLPKNRFKDLASDVYYELERRYPELKDMDFSNPTYGTPSPYNNASLYNKNNNPPQQSSIDGAASGQAESNTIVPETSTLRQEVISVDFRIQKPNIRPDNSNVNTNADSSPKPYSSNNSSNHSLSNNFPPLPDGMPPEYGSPKSRTQSTTSSASDLGHHTTTSQKSNKPDTVNFASLDSLMADLGDMIDPKKSLNEKRLKSDYEQRMNALQRRIKELESTNGGSDGDSARVRNLENQLDEKEKINQQQALKIEKLEQDFGKLNENYRQQQEIANDVQKEASKLLEEIKSLSIKNDDLYSEKEQSIAKIKSLSEEVNEWKSKYEKVKTELRNLKVDIVNDSSLAPTPDGAIDESRIVAYQVAIDDLLRAGRSEVSSNVLVAMKSIVIACKGITEEVDIYEQRKGSLMKAEDKEKLHTLKTKFSATLTNLMTAAKNHATGYGISPVSLLDAAASHLTASVVEMVKHVKLRRTKGQNSDRHSSEHHPVPSRENMSNESPNFQEDLNSSNTRPNSNSNVEKSNGYAIGLDELKDFLERQTESIVQSIQTLLTAIRNGSFGKELTDNINTITTIVLNVIAVCRDSFKSDNVPQSVRGNVILKELEDSIDKLDEMRESITDNSEDFLNNRAAKQRLASASFEIAKYTKELVGLFD
ncbi:31597_t:CDS:10 [Gigaspora margarita]|uniref:31597_t:CDS:1 n=1 Tax=Gigaspora margarita TaxID=4874 RepID=A0ABN7UT33_GIGMA|nr:31597_t:CDS:10 [Gigaspora margarita]